MMEPDAYNKGAKQQKSQDMKDRDDRDSHNKRSSFLVSEFSFDSQENEFDDWNLDEEHPQQTHHPEYKTDIPNDANNQRIELCYNHS